MTGTGTIVVWITEGTWRASVDAALSLAPADAPVTLLHVTEADLPAAAHGAYLGLLGRGRPGRDPGPRIEEAYSRSASELLEDAARRLGRPCDRSERQGAAEREVVKATAGAALLVMARDGDQTRLGPRSLGKAARFVVDHAPCPVLLVWPGTAPAISTVPEPPPGPPPGPPPRPGRPPRPHLRG